VVVDYAHTPDGLGVALASAREVAGTKQVIVVFGCGGDRDAHKRAPMGETAARLADRVVVTSDNPRTEDPMSIIEAAVAGVPPSLRDRVSIQVDRRLAIESAFAVAGEGDVVVIAGKGHEATQTIGTSVSAFDDRVVAREILESQQ
jgi:UDP-N-acetylmuramoyl-L-alanyl-D-glutamate--2,6-diaminopimelate ligase